MQNLKLVSNFDKEKLKNLLQIIINLPISILFSRKYGYTSSFTSITLGHQGKINTRMHGSRQGTLIGPRHQWMDGGQNILTSL